ncbi:hypothetical protein CVT25_008607 [Psilocybe cyanescens]|uniref:Protein kinase domain-containing protein n=1 Tax=Psilocybe cyanescens TaxID=93625 RepID=A0A409XNE1_PSICY|nr:hypothetical protein CVT25_008607 [Psilocybe cyanescens]
MSLPDWSCDFLITPTERFWVDMQPFLLAQGYRLRPRYDPQWKPSWLQVQVKAGERPPYPTDYEDCIESSGITLDAIRVKDGQKVVFKRVKANSDELTIAVSLSSEMNKQDPRNCAVPILDVIMLPGDDAEALLVMPQLMRFHVLPYRFLGEFCEFTLQILEGLEFLHEKDIAHRDLFWENLMMDATKVVPKGHHFRKWQTHDGISEDYQWNTRWSVRPVSYYIIDFGLSSQFASKDALVLGTLGQDKSVPELSNEVMYNPFMVDVYQFGSVIKRCVNDYEGLDAFRELSELMTMKNPNERPTAAESLALCKALVGKIKKSGSLDSRVWRRNSQFYMGLMAVERLAVKCGWNPLK